jgi:RNase H-fold protein (predicted Holliday junction resolvase)
MPTYTFKSNKTGKEWDDVMSYKELDNYYVKHDCEQVIGLPTTISGTGDIRHKHSDDFNDRLKEIHKHAGRHSTMSDTIK